jgi:energy-coupling factor transport system substrate-specific component
MRFLPTLSTPMLLLIPRAVAINLAGSSLAIALKLPIYLDTIGTMLAAALGGPLVGLLAGFCTSLFVSFSIDPSSLPFVFAQMILGFLAGCLARAGFFRNFITSLCAGALLATVNALVASTILFFVFGGAGSSGSVMITAVLLSLGKSLYGAVLSTQLTTDLADKLIGVAIVYWILRQLPLRTRELFHPARVASAG